MAGKQERSLRSVVEGRKSEIDVYNSQISNWDVRLAARKEALSRQFTAMETALSSLKQQSTWLAGQLSSLS